jgi:5-methylthioadenosine/S-adenosylhomocysteine deaminase
MQEQPLPSLPPGAEVEFEKNLQKAERFLLKGGIVLTLDPELGDFARADMLVEHGQISEIRPNIEVASQDVLVLDAANRIILPGFVDTHCHSYQGLLRGLLPNGVVAPDYDRDIQKNITAHYRPEDAYAGVLITALGMLNMGTTTMVDISQVSHSPEHVDANIQALKDSGMRAVYAQSRGIGPAAQYPQDIHRVLPLYFNSDDQLLTPALAVDKETATFKVAREAGVRAILHVRVNSEPLMAIGRAGLLREGDEFIHCCHLTEDAWKLIKDSGGRTSHSPPLEMAMGHGMPAIQAAMDAGLRPSLSCDHCATVAQDMFGLMRATFGIQRLAIQQRRRDGERDVPPLITCREVLEFATIEGAKCAALDRKIGTLTPGKQADFIMLRADDLDIWPLNNVRSAVVNLMNPGHVDAVFVRGAVKKWRGRLVGVDVAGTLKSVEASKDAVLRSAGFEIDLMQ